MPFELSDAQIAEMRIIKQHFPYRIVFGVVDKDTGEFSTWAKPTKHAMNRLAREGHAVYLIQ